MGAPDALALVALVTAMVSLLLLPSPWRIRVPSVAAVVCAVLAFCAEARGEGPAFGALAGATALVAGIGPVVLAAVGGWLWRRRRAIGRAIAIGAMAAAALGLVAALAGGLAFVDARRVWRRCPGGADV